MNPKVTIGLPIYNGEALCRTAIDSVLAQRFSDFELLISDNCSTDGTEDICRQYASKDARVRYTKTDRNLGAAGNYCRVVHLARGEYFRWISHDDWMSPDFISECLAVAETNPEIITVAPIIDVVEHSGRKTQSITSYVGRQQWSTHRLEQYAQMMAELAYCETHDDGLFMIAYEYAFHRLSLLRRTRLVMPFISSDFVLAAELALWGQLVFLDKPLSAFALSTTSAGTTANFTAWNPEAIQRMLDPSRTGRLDMLLSVRRRHYEHIVAVMRSPLSPVDKARALEFATRPMLARFGARLRSRLSSVVGRAGSAP